jgi:hypothetical protein
MIVAVVPLARMGLSWRFGTPAEMRTDLPVPAAFSA